MDPQYSGPTDMEGLDPEVDIGSGSPTRSRRIRFTLPRRGRPRPSDSDPEGGSPTPVRCRRVRFMLPRRPGPEEVMDAVRKLRKDVMDAIEKNEEKRNAQHLELLAMIRTLQGPTSQGPPS
ncbi:hypothetical protein LWI29_018686 [Acer saccharum]|uniref:Uncharacterized protein n=1 Tax=Acer saccharum TaxID=4024 RepID=A0AA39RZL0_ACESA|nr:hypothetical protein LWI29_018686 [Acer saccharum]